MGNMMMMKVCVVGMLCHAAFKINPAASLVSASDVADAGLTTLVR
jgi:hypothetical protein